MSRAVRNVRWSMLWLLAIVLKVSTHWLVQRKPAAVTLSTLIGWRYPPFLLRALASVSVVALDWRDVGRALVFLDLPQFLLRTRLAILTSPANRGVLIWEPEFGHRYRCHRTVLLVGTYYGSLEASDACLLPYFCHPAIYETGLYHHADIRQNSNQTRNQMLFFSGSVYSSHRRLDQTFKMLNRAEIIRSLTQCLERPEFEQLREHSSITLVGSSRDILAKHSLNQKDYLKALGNANFALCPPGLTMPHSHSLIEAMAMGCMPITNYHRLMSPSLRPGINCLGFDTIPEIEETLLRIQTMPQASMASLREGVLAYYADYLKPEAAGANLLANLASATRMAFNDESGR